MQVERLFQMLYLLLEKETVTAKELSERFEVSTRTIYRDLDTLSSAGVPVYAVKGRGGGIRILPGFVLDKSVLSQQEQSGILAALQGFKATGDEDAAKVLGKMSSLFHRSEPAWISVDFSGWSGHKELFESLKFAVQHKKRVRFGYFGAIGKETLRTAEPLQLYFKGVTWYLKAFCLDAGDMRLFRLSRIRRLQVLEESFIRELDPGQGNQGEDLDNWQGKEVIRLHVQRSHAFRVYDEFAPGTLLEQPDGSFIVEMSIPVDNWTLGYILSFGASVTVLEPAPLRKAIREIAEQIVKNNQ